MDSFQGEQIVDRNLGKELTRTRDLEAVLEEPDFDAAPLHRIVAMGHRVEYRFLPREIRILGHLAKAGTHEPGRSP